MMFILLRTLQVNGWFESHGELSHKAYVLKTFTGDYNLEDSPDTLNSWSQVTITQSMINSDEGWMSIYLDSLVQYQVKLSTFEDEQVLLELFRTDTSFKQYRMEGCEILLSENEMGGYSGSTIGNFCGFEEGSTEYLVLDLSLNDPTVSLQIEHRLADDQTYLELNKYLLKRIHHGK